MAPNEDTNEKSEEELEEEKPSEEIIEEVEEEVDEEELDAQKELDRLKFHYRGYTLEELKNEYGSVYPIIAS